MLFFFVWPIVLSLAVNQGRRNMLRVYNLIICCIASESCRAWCQWMMADAQDLLISTPSSGFSRGQGRNTTMACWKCLLSSQIRSNDSEETAASEFDSESHFGACRTLRNTPSTTKEVFLQEKEKRLRPLLPSLPLLAKIDVKMGKGETSDLFKLWL